MHVLYLHSVTGTLASQDTYALPLWLCDWMTDGVELNNILSLHFNLHFSKVLAHAL